MHKLRKYYYDNKEKIWKIILMVALIIGILQILNYLAKKENEKLLNSENNYSGNNNSQQNNSVFISETSSVTGEELSSKEIKKVENIINTFVNYCNEKQIENAYNLLSDKCKEKLYPTINEFTENYYQNIFKTKKIITIENWYSNTYKVRFIDDLLSKGNIDKGEEKQDYITIIYENEEQKLNINSYIDSEEINKEKVSNNIEIIAMSKDIFMDYEIYNIKVTNNSKNTIMLDPLTSTKTIFLKDKNGIKYVSYSHELLEKDLTIKGGLNRVIGIKFTNSYNSTTKIDRLTFSKVISNYEEYINSGDKEYIQEITVNL